MTQDPIGIGQPDPQQSAGGLALVLGLAAVVLCTLLFYTGLADWLFQRSLLPVTPGQYMVVVGALATLASGVAIVGGFRPHPLLVVVPAIYIGMVLVSGVFLPQDPQLVLARIAFMVALASLTIAALQAPPRWIFLTLTTALVFLCALNIIDYFFSALLPAPLSDLPGRAAGFHINPNSSASVIALSVPVVASGLRQRPRLGLYALSLVAVFLTFSRGGMVLWLCSALLTEAFIMRPVGLSAKVLIATALGLAAMVVVVVFGDEIAQGITLLLGSYLSPALASRLYLDVHDFAADQRRYAAAYAWRLFTEYPLFGSGVGLVGRWHFEEFSHNMILQTLSEFGLIGLAWLGAFWAMLWRGVGRFGGALVALWLLAAVFSHNLFDHLSIALIIAAYAVAGRAKAGNGP